MDDILKDKRFAHVTEDPRFRKIPVGQRKVKIDNRFKQMFTDKKFKLKYTVDKRGKPVNLSTNENLKKYYELSNSESSEGEEHGGSVDSKKEFDNEKPKDVTTEIPDKSRKVKFEPASSIDYARGEGVFSSSSSEEEDSGDDDEDGVDDKDISKIDHHWGEADDNVIELQESTHRLAVCSMDWDRVKAKDIFMLLNSFKPTNGLIKSVKIYPSEFGKQRMAEEEIQGPKELKELKEESDNEEIDEDLVEKEGTLYNTEKLRQYQLKRLKYYYAVVDCDSVSTADQIYKDCDNMEYESSATRLDLRFIPDDTEFSDDDVRSVCNEVPSDYQPKFFSNAALSQSKVDLTWDETDRDRMELTSRPFIGKGEDINDEDLATYLASSSDDEAPDYAVLLGGQGENSNADEESPDDEDSQVDKYRKLLLEIDSEEKKKERDVEMEITWEPGLRDATEDLIKKKKKSKDITVWETYLQKKKEKKKQKTQEKRKARYIQNEGDSVTNKGVNVRDSAVEDDDRVVEGQQAFSDDELPDDVDKSDPFFITESKKREKLKTKKKGKKKKHTEENAMDENEKAKLSLLVMDIDDKKHFNLNDLIQKEGKKKKKTQEPNTQEIEDDFVVNVADPRFDAVYDSHLFNIDPSAPEFRKTKGTEAMIMEKLQRSSNMDQKKRKIYANNEETVKKLKVNETVKVSSTGDDLASILKSVKAKTKHYQANKIRK